LYLAVQEIEFMHKIETAHPQVFFFCLKWDAFAMIYSP
jgi:hypothetical protein